MGFLYVLEGLRVPLLDTLFAAVTYLGGEGIFIAVAIIVFWCVNKKNGYYLIAAGVGGTVVSQSMKILCRVPRPWVRDPAFTIVESARADAGGYSFPSGHSQNSVVALGGMARFMERKWVKAALWVLAGLVCFSRMYLGVHTPADVAVGAVIGLVLVFGLWPLFQKDDPRITDGVRPRLHGHTGRSGRGKSGGVSEKQLHHAGRGGGGDDRRAGGAAAYRL